MVLVHSTVAGDGNFQGSSLMDLEYRHISQQGQQSQGLNTIFSGVLPRIIRLQNQAPPCGQTRGSNFLFPVCVEHVCKGTLHMWRQEANVGYPLLSLPSVIYFLRQGLPLNLDLS